MDGVSENKQKIYAGPDLGYVVVGELDQSGKARTMPEGERRMMYHDGEWYRQFKRYKGAYCLGVYWAECDQEGEETR